MPNRFLKNDEYPPSEDTFFVANNIENEKGEYWTYSINCEIVDEAYRRLASSGFRYNDAVDRWSGKLIELQDDPGEDREEDSHEQNG